MRRLNDKRCSSGNSSELRVKRGAVGSAFVYVDLQFSEGRSHEVDWKVGLRRTSTRLRQFSPVRYFESTVGKWQQPSNTV